MRRAICRRTCILEWKNSDTCAPTKSACPESSIFINVRWHVSECERFHWEARTHYWTHCAHSSTLARQIAPHVNTSTKQRSQQRFQPHVERFVERHMCPRQPPKTWVGEDSPLYLTYVMCRIILSSSSVTVSASPTSSQSRTTSDRTFKQNSWNKLGKIITARS